MATKDEEVMTVPDAPGFLPAAEQKKWQATYSAAFKRAQSEMPDHAHQWRGIAEREANRMLRAPEPKSYEEAMAMPAHLCSLPRIPEDAHPVTGKPKLTDTREVVDGKLRLVTIDGRKHEFAAPEKKSGK
jgi:hypothetical protein